MENVKTISINGNSVKIRYSKVGFYCDGCGCLCFEGTDYNSKKHHDTLCIDCYKDVMLADEKKSATKVNSTLKKNGLIIHANITFFDADVIHSLKALDNGYDIKTINGRKTLVGASLGWSSIIATMRELTKVNANMLAVFDVEDTFTHEVARNVPFEHKDLFVHKRWKVARYNKVFGAR